jgi:glycosyltransferase involved in cell wall biosynthesis
MKIAMVAPPWTQVPPVTYGGIERVVALLADRMVKLGQDVTLFCAPGSHSSATMINMLPQAYPAKVGSALYEVDYVLRTLQYITKVNGVAKTGSSGAYDVIHDHTSTGLAFTKYCDVPMVHTMHCGHEGDRGDFYKHHTNGSHLVAISNAQERTAPAGVVIDAVVPNPLDVEEWPLRVDKRNFALWVGNFQERRGAHRAVLAAKIAGMPLIMAGPIQSGQRHYFETKVKPHIDNDRIRYIGEVGGHRKKALFANACAFLMPTTFNEPFGLVMVEALACGTPVIAFPNGAAGEIVQDGINGWHVADVPAMGAALHELQDIDPYRCRDSVEARYDAGTVAEEYMAVYENAVATQLR